MSPARNAALSAIARILLLFASVKKLALLILITFGVPAMTFADCWDNCCANWSQFAACCSSHGGTPSPASSSNGGQPQCSTASSSGAASGGPSAGAISNAAGSAVGGAIGRALVPPLPPLPPAPVIPRTTPDEDLNDGTAAGVGSAQAIIQGYNKNADSAAKSMTPSAGLTVASKAWACETTDLYNALDQDGPTGQGYERQLDNDISQAENSLLQLPPDNGLASGNTDDLISLTGSSMSSNVSKAPVKRTFQMDDGTQILVNALVDRNRDTGVIGLQVTYEVDQNGKTLSTGTNVARLNRNGQFICQQLSPAAAACMRSFNKTVAQDKDCPDQNASSDDDDDDP